MRYRVKTIAQVDREWIVEAPDQHVARDDFFTGELIDIDEWPEEVRYVEEVEE